MKLQQRLGLDAMPISFATIWGLTVLCAVIVVVLASLTAPGGAAASVDWLKGALLLQVSALFLLPLVATAQLVQARRVQLARIWPRSALQLSLRSLRNALWFAWVLAAAPTLLIALLAQGPTLAPSSAGIGPALAAATLALFALLGAAWQGLIPAAWLLAPAPAVAWVFVRGWDATWADLLAAGPLGHALGLLSLPAVLAWLQQRFAQPLRLVAGPAPRTPRQWFAAAASPWRERWRYVDARQGGSALAGVLIQIPVQAMSFKNIVLVPWGSEVTGWYGLRILLLAFVVTPALRSRDLHWRWLLAPGGAFRRRLGQRIVWSTLVSLAVIFGVVGLVALPIMHWTGPSWADTLMRALSYGAPLAFDLVLATALAACVRGLSSRRGWPLLVLGGALLAWLTAGWLAGLSFGASGNTAFWQRDAAFAAATLMLAAVFALLANRAWARADLGLIFRQAQTVEKAETDPWGTPR